MLSRNAIIAIIFFLLGASILVVGYMHETRIREGKKILVKKEQPYDDQWIKRSYPSTIFAQKAMLQSLEKLKAEVNNRGGGVGFNEEWIIQGPGNIGARINVLDIHPTNSNIIYVGFSHGGIWKTTNAGQTWNPVFDDNPYLAIGAISIDPVNPNIVFAGTGDVNVPGNMFLGNGIYVSKNGGLTWSPSGLEKSKIVSKIVFDPLDHNHIYAGTIGNPFEKNADRGMYESKNGGITWNKILYINDETGIMDIEVNPVNPKVMFATSFSRIRSSNQSIVSSPFNKIYKTADGGLNWAIVNNALPEDIVTGRISIDLCRANPDVIYISYIGSSQDIEYVYKSEDGGVSFFDLDALNTGLQGGMTGGFGWYFGQIVINPQDCNVANIMGVDLYGTNDGGLTWSLTAPPWWSYEVHADKHDIKYDQAGNLYLATDGGLYRTADMLTWEDVENIPATQFYRVAHNPHDPTVYYGGAQDNGTTAGNKDNINDWFRYFGGDGFLPVFHPTEAGIIYYETQNGGIFASVNGDFFNIQDSIDTLFPDIRFNWDTPYFLDNQNPSTLYVGGNAVLASYDNGYNFVQLSGDLTGDITYLKNVHTITSMHQSDIDPATMTVGTGNGYVWVTKNTGMTWDSVHQNGLPDRYVTCVKTSTINSNKIYTSFTGYQYNEELVYLYVSVNNGQTWTSIQGDLPESGINDILILPGYDDEIIFVATDAGVYGTTNGGLNWQRLGVNMPLIPVSHLTVNTLTNELVAATYARSIQSYPLEQLTSTIQSKDQKEELLAYFNGNTLNWSLSGTSIATELSLYDISGNIVFNRRTSNNYGNHEVGNLPSGLYVVLIKTKAGFLSKKLIQF